MENKAEYSFTRQEVETIVGKTLTDTEWTVMANELVDALDYYFTEEVPRLFADLDSMIAE
jgi:hypothetical protein